MITSRNADDLREFKGEIEMLGRRVLALELDLRNESSIRDMAPRAIDHFGTVDILVNNAGCNVRKPAVDLTWNDWNLVLDTNLRGSFFVAQTLAPHMIERGYGRIINIGSVTSVFDAGIAPYQTSSRRAVGELPCALVD